MARRTIFGNSGADPIRKDMRIVNPDGTPTDAFLRNWQRQRANNSGVATDIDSAIALVNALAAKPITVTTPITGGGTLGGVFTPIGHANSAVTPGSYTSADITVDAKGHITAAANGSGGGGIPKGGMSGRTTNQAIPAATDTIVIFTTENFDDSGFIDIAGQPTRITIPVGFTRCILNASLLFDGAVTNKFAQIKKNGGFTYVGQAQIGAVSLDRMTLSTGYIPVVAGDYFEVNVQSIALRNVTTAYFNIIAW